MRVVDRSTCRGFADSAAATYAVWEQVRTALSATQLTSAEGDIELTILVYQRSLDPTLRRVRAQSTTLRLS